MELGTREGGVESPLLYVLYVFDLVQRLASCSGIDDPVFLAGQEVRVLQFADDIALLSHTEEGLDDLLACWAQYCDDTHQETSVKKTEVMVVCTDREGRDPSVRVQRGALSVGRWLPMTFLYKSSRIAVIETFFIWGCSFIGKMGLL